MKTLAITKLLVALCVAFTLCDVSAKNLPLSQAQLKANYHATAKLAENGDILLRFRSPEWSAGVSVLPPQGSAHWDFSQAKYLAVDVENLSTDRQMRLTMHISSGSRNQNKDTSGLNHTNNTAVAVKKFRSCNTGIGLNPGEKRTMKIELPHSAIYGHPASFGRRVLDTDSINSVDFEMQWPFELPSDGLVNCRLSNLRLEGDAPLDAYIPEENYLPFVDKFGQYNHGEWPEKIHSAEELQSAHQQEVASLKPAPATWDRFGGWANGPKLKATGAFRVEKVDGRWWLVTPDGTLFWSTGLDVVQRHSDPSNVHKHPTWYDAKPDGDGVVRFTERNLIMKYGKKNYASDFDAMLFKRLRSWGINTIGAWATASIMEHSETPYTLTIGQLPKEFPRMGKFNFYDVFHPDFEAKMSNYLRTRANESELVKKSLTDPLCIGYFIDNELPFSKLGNGLLSSPANCFTRQEFIRRMQAKYHDDIAALNQAWETNFTAWDELSKLTKSPKGKQWRSDLDAMLDAIVERYFAACNKAIKSYAPHRLYLGCRFVGFRQSDRLWKNAAKYCDIISVNAYTNCVYNVPAKSFRDKPVLLTEFHFGAYDRGMLSASLAPVYDQQERATSYIRLVQGALCQPNLVGAHYFQFRDQPITGRFDGEGYQIGFVDICDTPYEEITAASREVGTWMYQYRNQGKLVNEMNH